MNYKFLLAGATWLFLASALSGKCPGITVGTATEQTYLDYDSFIDWLDRGGVIKAMIFLNNSSPIDWSNCRITNGINGLSIYVSPIARDSLKNSTFINTKFNNVSFVNGTGDTIDLSNAKLQGTSFIDTDLSLVSFGKNITELPVKSFRGSRVNNDKYKNVKCLDDKCQVGHAASVKKGLKPALLFLTDRPTKPLGDLFKTIKLSDYVCSNRTAGDFAGYYYYEGAGEFEGVNLSGVDFSGIYLVGTNFTGAKLENTKWQGAVIVGSQGQQRLPPANPAGASLKGADFRGVRYDTGFSSVEGRTITRLTNPLETDRLLQILSGAADLTDVVLPDSTMCADTKCNQRLTLTSISPICAQGQEPEIRLFKDGERLYTGRCSETTPEKPSTQGQPPSTQTTLRIMQKQTEVPLQNFDSTCTSKAPCTIVYEESQALNSAYDTLKKQLDFVGTVTRTPINRTTATGAGRGKKTVTEKVGTKITATVYSKKGVLPPAQKTTKTRRRA